MYVIKLQNINSQVIINTVREKIELRETAIHISRLLFFTFEVDKYIIYTILKYYFN